MLEDQIWKTYWRLKIISESEKRNNIRYFMCECECWNNITTRLSWLRNWTTKSCWCLQKEKVRKHGIYWHPLYMTWINIIQRTENEENNRYYRYWERWIRMCKEWRENILEFYSWAINNWFEEWLQIDRIDNNWNYCPENCRFISPKENMWNRSNSIIPWWLKKLCKEKWKNYYTVYNRIKRWLTLEDSLI